MTKLYTGRVDADGMCRVSVIKDDGRRTPLRKRLDLYNHSPTGFEWGYGGSGSAQLALAILADCLGDDEQAVQLHQRYKARVVQRLPRRKIWNISEAEVHLTVKQLREEQQERRNCFSG